jgi:hypothetical protein
MRRFLLAGVAAAALLVAGAANEARASWLSEALHAAFGPGYSGYSGPYSGYYAYPPAPVYPGYGYSGYYAPGYGYPVPRWSYSYGPGYYRPWYGYRRGHEWHEHDWHAHHEWREHHR